MMLRRCVIRCANSTNFVQRPTRSISIGSTRRKTEEYQRPPRELYDMYTQKLHVDELLSKEGRRTFETAVEEPIIVKKFFVSKVDNKQLMYPEIISKMKLGELNAHVAEVIEYLNNGVFFDDKGYSDSMHEQFKKMNLYGYNVPTKYGGYEYNETELLLVSEPEGKYIDIALPLISHRIACRNIKDYGTEEQCTKYLPKLARGDLVATTAYEEWNKDDLISIKAKAEYDDEEEKWLLNGTKSFVMNAAKSNLLLVLAETKTTDRKGDLNSTRSVLIVDASLPGITVHKKDGTIGHNKIYQAKVSFKDVCLPPDCVLSIPGTGNHIALQSQLNQRLYRTLVNLMQMKEISKYILNLLESTEQHALEKDMETTFETEANSLRLELAKSVCAIYATESSLYMTSGLMDLYENTNVDLETCILQTYSQDELLSMAMNAMNYIDSRVTVTEHPLNAFIRSAVQLQTCGESKDTLKLFIGVIGIQYAGEIVHEEIKTNRNPFSYPENAMKRFFSRESLDKYESSLTIHDAVSNDFELPASWLEASIERLRIGTKTLMEVHGRNLPKEHCEIQKLSAAATLNYISFACLARANRSWLLQLPESAHERIVAGCICDKNGKAIKLLMQSIEDGPVATFETYYHHVAKILIKNQSYFPVHPLTRFF